MRCEDLKHHCGPKTTFQFRCLPPSPVRDLYLALRGRARACPRGIASRGETGGMGHTAEDTQRLITIMHFTNLEGDELYELYEKEDIPVTHTGSIMSTVEVCSQLCVNM